MRLFAQLLESGLGVHEIGPHLDEILLYLRIIFSIEPSCSVKCVTLCLKSLFNLNLAGLMNEYIQQQLNNAINFNATIQSTANSDSVSNTNSMSSSTINNSSAGLSNHLSNSLTSLTSNSNQTLTNQPTAKREKSSILATLVTNQLNQLTRFMYSQSLMFKSDNLMGSILQLNPALDLQQLNSQLSSFSSLPVMSTSTSTTIATVSTVSKVSSFSANPFNFFSLIRNKNKAENNTAAQQISQQKELQQQKLKQQKTDHKTITQYINKVLPTQFRAY